jgi:DAACS family dicarboxylate/amino acid:cation (Na+ or H+) symporter
MRLALHWRILIGAAIGVIGGVIAHAMWWDDPATRETLKWLITTITDPVGRIFLRLLFMLVLPLIFAALVLGVSEFQDLRSFGRIGVKTLAYTVVVSSIAVVLGLFMVNAFKPGAGVSETMRAELTAQATAEYGEEAAAKTKAIATGADLLIKIVPDNPMRAAWREPRHRHRFAAAFRGCSMSRCASSGW